MYVAKEETNDNPTVSARGWLGPGRGVRGPGGHPLLPLDAGLRQD